MTLSSFANLRDINVELIPDEKNSEKHILLFKLLSPQHTDIFSILCEDLIASIATVTNETQLVKELLNRFAKWESLFDKAASHGLTPEEQRGLFGELFFIRKYLKNNPDFLYVINSWVGTEKQAKDFQSAGWGVEVKTSQGNNHQKVLISNERQLDTSNLEHLFLYHLSLEVRQQSGETLNQLADSITEIIGSDFTVLNRFKNKLLEGGYFEQHKHLYEEVGYFIRQETFYKVETDFPRIEEKDIRNGVGDVKYSIVLGRCSDYMTSEQQIFQTIASHA